MTSTPNRQSAIGNRKWAAIWLCVLAFCTRFASADPRPPLGLLHIAGPELVTPANPRGWKLDGSPFNTHNPDGSPNPAAFAEFQRRLLGTADFCVRTCKSAGMDGVIVWQIEGAQHYMTAGYYGEPRELAPEMRPVVAPFFKKFTDAGLRTGVCLRASKLAEDYGSLTQLPVLYKDAILISKAKAAAAWGCSIYYVDSNVDEWDGKPFAPLWFEHLAEAFPKGPPLVIPEWHDERYFQSKAPIAPYQKFVGFLANLKKPEGQREILGTPPQSRAKNPNAFTFIDMSGATAESIRPHRDALVALVRAGDVLAAACWYRAPELALVQDLYKDAGFKPTTQPTTDPTTARPSGNDMPKTPELLTLPQPR